MHDPTVDNFQIFQNFYMIESQDYKVYYNYFGTTILISGKKKKKPPNSKTIKKSSNNKIVGYGIFRAAESQIGLLKILPENERCL